MTNKNNHLSDYQALAEFRYQIRRYLRLSEEAAREAAIEPQQHQLMLAVKGLPDGEEPRVSYLAERLQIHHHSAVELVDRMEKKGLIHRVRADSDRREVHLQLTPRGNLVLAHLTKHMRDELRSAAPTLVATLRKLTVQASLAAQRSSKAGKRGAA
jgi:DNA-binding MarR family transcriptional regulator